ncbi:MAG: hypothetical protein LLF83_02605 [Methanobacterium sp.]|nr:hypothetical protein [Methanobacterium sp.]
MAGKDDQNTNDKKIKSPGQRFIALWILGVLLIFLLVTGFMVGVIYDNKQISINRHSEWMNPNSTEPGLTLSDLNLPTNSTPTKVYTGIYVDRIKDLSLSDSTWTVDFYLWFRWNGSDVNPGENFQIIDGEVDEDKKELLEEYTNGTEHYQVYYITAKITKFFDVLRFPIDNHVLNIKIEDDKTLRQDLIYVPDNNSSNINPQTEVHGYEIDKMTIIEKPHIYESNFGDPRILDNASSSYSQLRVGIDISRPDLGFYFRIFIGLFVAVAAALVALFIKPTEAEPRFGLGAGALFVAIANTIITSSLIPKTGIMTLADMVNDLGLLLILITLIESTVSLYLYGIKDEKELSRVLDRTSFLLLLIIYIVANIAIIVAAWY